MFTSIRMQSRLSPFALSCLLLASSMAASAAPANDNSANATVISTTPAVISASNVGATLEPNEGGHAGNVGGASVWWRWTPPRNTRVTLNTFGSSFDTLLEIYVVFNNDRFLWATSDDGNGTLQSSISFTTLGGFDYQYLIVVDGYNATSSPGLAASGSIRLNINLDAAISVTSPANNATVVGPTNLPISTTVTPAPGSPIARVEFFGDGIFLGSDTTAPYSFVWTNVVAGQHYVNAVAVDTAGNQSISTYNVFTANPPDFSLITLVPVRSTWKYLDDGSDQGSGWRANDFNDAAWSSGPGPLGYGDPHIATTVSSGPAGNFHITTYFRRAFYVTNAAQYSSLRFRIMRDDGPIVYLNGLDAFRLNMPFGDVNYRTLANSSIGGSAESAYNLVTIPDAASYLREGLNVLAVEMHQQAPDSSDVSFDLELLAGAGSSIRLASPYQGAVYNIGTAIGLVAQASAATSAVTQVTFTANDLLIGTDTTPPYEFTWTDGAVGDHALRAVSHLSSGLMLTSAPVVVSITPSNAPSITSYFPAAGTVSNLTQVRVSFNERVTGVDPFDLRLNGVPAIKATTLDATNWVFGFPQPAPGTVTVSWATSHQITDWTFPPLAFDHTASNATWTYVLVDVQGPSITETLPRPGSVFSLSSIQVTFTEPVTGVNASDLLINGLPAESVTGSGAIYTFHFQQPDLGRVSISWDKNHGIRDLSSANNPFDAGGPGAQWEYNLEPPRVFLATLQDEWSFKRGTNEASTPFDAWRSNSFDASTWQLRPATFYYGENWPVGTLIDDMRYTYSSIFLRKTFVPENPGLLSDLRLRAQCDDGFIVWLNGVEVQRYNVPPGNIPYNGLATDAVQESGTPSVPLLTYSLPGAHNALVAGTNVLAVQVFNATLDSSDLVFDCDLTAGVLDPSTVPPAVIGVSPAQGEVTSFTQLTVTFSEPVTGVDDEDLLINGLAASSVTASSNSYTFSFNQPSFGQVRVTWGEGHGIQDTDSPPKPFNGQAASSTFTYTLINQSAPTLFSQSPLGGSTLTSLSNISVTFSEAVTGIDPADLLINGAGATAVSGSGVNWTFSFPQPAFGVVAITWATNHGITDTETPANAFDGARAGATWNYTLRDLTPPVVISQNPPANASISNLTEIQVTFSEAVSGVNATDLLLNGVPALTVSGNGAQYTFSVVQPNAAVLRVSWVPNHGIADLAANPNPFNAAAPSSSWEYQFIDRAAPIVQTLQPAAGATLASVSSVSVAFNEPVGGVNPGDLLVNGQPAQRVRGSLSGPYEFEFNSITNGLVQFTWVGTNGIHDFASPPNNFVGGSWSYTVNASMPQSAVVINEIMYHPSSAQTTDEYIELFNTGNAGVNLTGWRFSDGVQFTFPNITLGSGQFLVVAANLQAFQQKYPSVTNVIGNWDGTLSNSREDIDLDNAAGERIDSVRYSDEGDWGLRQRGPLDRGAYGWEWTAEHDGIGKSLELCNASLPNEYGQNWKASTVLQGTPGRTNSVATTNVAPLILNTVHSPAIPTSSQAISITSRIIDEQPVTVTLFYRTHNTLNPPAFTSTNMVDNGTNGDGGPGDGLFGITLPAQTNRTIIEFYVEARDASGRTNFWPAPAGQTNLTGLQDTQIYRQTANALLQVDDASYTGPHPIHRLIMTESERIEFQGNDRQSDAEMNCTLITRDGSETLVRYLCGMRIRGAGSRGAAVPNYRVNIPHDNPWNGVTELNHNAQYGFSQVIGAALARKANLPASHARTIQVRVNGVNLANSGLPQYGNYALVEVINSDWAENHFPDDSDGNIYRASTGNHSANFNDRGTDPQSYRNAGFLKASNITENDWSDLIALCQALNTNDTAYADAVRKVANVELWMRYFAFFSMAVSMETSLGTGRGDDYAMYRGAEDPRFIVLAHDLDTILGQGDTGGTTNALLFRMINPPNGNANVPQMFRFMRHPDFVPLYYKELKRMAETTFSPAEINALLDQVLGSDVPTLTLNNMKTFAVGRSAWVLSQIPLTLAVTNSVAGGNGYIQTANNTITLSGRANSIDTRRVRVNGVQANWVPADGNWTAPGISLRPGINRILVQALDTSDLEIARTQVDVWYDNGANVNLSGTLGSNTVWTAAAGPYYLTGPTTVPSGGLLTIEPGTTIYFAQGASLTVNGRLICEGTDLQHIRLTRLPGSSTAWGGIRLNGPLESRITYTDFEFASTGDPVAVNNSVVLLDHVTWTGTTRTIVDLVNSSALIRNCVFPTIIDNETLHGNIMPPNGYVIIESNYFGGTTGYSDIIDFTGGQRPGPILQVMYNTFNGGSDDALDLDGTDAHIEGNRFMNIHQDGLRDSGSHAIATDNGSEVVVVRNIFYDNDHALLLKNGASAIFENNTVARIRTNANSIVLASVINFGEPHRGVAGAAGAILNGNIFWDVDQNRHFLHFTNGAMYLQVNNSILSGTNHPGAGNLSLDPRFNNVSAGDFSLAAGSPAIGTGPNGLDMGALVPAGASISGEPSPVTPATSATLTIAGPGITDYKFRLNDGSYSSERSVTNPISITGLSNGFYTVSVLGKNSAGVWQVAPTLSRTWKVQGGLRRLIINEVLARNTAVPTPAGGFPDVIELYNGGASVVSLAGMTLTDDPDEPAKYTFPAGVFLNSGDYLLVYADSSPGAGLRLGFALDAGGDQLLLFDRPDNGGSLLDSISFGPQLENLSIGRNRQGDWVLCEPTLMGPNAAARTGDPHRLRINEWLASGRAPYTDDFVELLNLEALPVNMGGLSLTDEPYGAPEKSPVQPLSFIPGNGFIAFQADGENAPGHLNFNLSALQGTIALLDGLKLIDCVVYGPQVTGVSQGRSINGQPPIVSFPQPTPGAPNPRPGSTNQSIVLWEVLASNASYTEPDGATPDWVELRNPSTNDIDLAGMSLSDQADEPRRYVFSAGTVVPAGGFLVIRCNPDLPASTNNAPFALNASGSAVYLYDKLSNGGGLLDGVVFGLQATDFSIGRTNVTGAWVLCNPSLAGPNIPATLGPMNALRINEWMADPGSGDDWFEVYNSAPQPIELSGLHLSDNLGNTDKFTIAPLSFIGAGLYGYQRFEADDNVEAGTHHVNFRLSNDGESLAISDPTGNIIDFYTFEEQSPGISEGRLPDGSSTVMAFPDSATPGQGNYRRITDVVINEVLSASTAPLEDAIELHNLSNESVEIGGWYLSDQRTQLKKFRIPQGTIISERGFVMFYEADFNSIPGDPASFSLNSTKGDEVWLSAADASGELTGFRTEVRFGAAERGVSFGRFTTSQGVEFVALNGRSFGVDEPANVLEFRQGQGLSNGVAKVGPAIISEIMYHPADPNGNDNVELEYIELQNITGIPLPLHDPNNPQNTWRLRDAVDFEFPPGLTLPAGGSLLVVSFNPVDNPLAFKAFQKKFPLSPSTILTGPFRGRLANDSENVELYKPLPPVLAPDPDAGLVPYVLVEQVHYGDQAPWSPLADGEGFSLQRIHAGEFGNDPVNWVAAQPTPARPTTDSDGDGMDDWWEQLYGLAVYDPLDAGVDSDSDGVTNLDEFIAGTDPSSAASKLGIDSITAVGGSFPANLIVFQAVSNKTYTLEFSTTSAEGPWELLTHVPAYEQSLSMEVFDPVPPGAPQRFYRLATPAMGVNRGFSAAGDLTAKILQLDWIRNGEAVVSFVVPANAAVSVLQSSGLTGWNVVRPLTTQPQTRRALVIDRAAPGTAQRFYVIGLQ